MSESLTVSQARKLALLAQRMPPSRQPGPAVAATLSAIEHLGYIQIDTISVVQRAHHHILWNRNSRYQAVQLEQLLEEKKVFEYWSHAAAYLPFRDYRFSLPRKQALATGEQEHWYDRDERLMKLVLKRISEEGPLMARDFEQSERKLGDWKAKPAKQALEYLFMQGDLMVPRRIKFQKVYDLTERVLPDEIDSRVPSREENARFLITRYLEANGLGRAVEMAYLRKGVKPLIVETLKEMVLGGELIRVSVGGVDYFAQPASLELLARPLARSKLKILSPFDNLVIQRERVKALFGFDYLIECYLPEAKRKYGYFTLPILWDGKLVARMDCKADRKAGLLHVHHLALEDGLSKTDVFFEALRRELESFLRFNDCRSLRLHRVSPSIYKEELEAVLRKFLGRE